MQRKFAFISAWKCQIYDKIGTYIKYLFQACNIPFIVVDTVADLRTYVNDHPNEHITVVYMFSYINVYTMPLAEVDYLMFVLDPEHNLDKAFRHHMDVIRRVVCGFITLTTIQDEYFKHHWPNIPIFHMFQGYVPYEDFFYIVDPSKKTVDVAAPGFEGYYGVSSDRCEVVQKLRAHGLIVNDKVAFESDLNKTIEYAKVYIYYPFDKRYVTWHGQRTLWALNKQICVVTTKSYDQKCEQFYSNNLFIHAPWDIDKFVDVVVDVVRSGRWKQAGIDGHKNFKQHYDALNLFQGPFYDWCLTMTNRKTCPNINAYFRFCIQPGARWFRFYFMPFLRLHFPDIIIVEPHELSKTQVHAILDGFNDPVARGILEYKNLPHLKIIIVSGEPYGTNHDFVHLIIDCKRDPNRLPKNVPWIYLPNYVMGFGERFHHPKQLLLPEGFSRQDAIEIMKTKTKFCAFLYSNPVPFRDQFFHDMAKYYKSADALGCCCNPNAKPRGETDRIAYDGMKETFYDTAVTKYEPYKFVIAFENSDILGYITEKLVNPVLARAIPIYFGAPDLFSDGVFNPKSIIHVRDFKNNEDCIQYIKKVDQDPELYLEYLQQPLFTNNKLPHYFDSDYLLPKFMEVFKK